ncbi:MAG: hypothetical protein AB1791_14180 [Chloroflexota bacterium]
MKQARWFRSPAVWLAAFLLFFLTTSLSLAVRGAELKQAAAGVPRLGFDPLSPAEQSLALDAALADPAATRLLAGAQRTEVLLIEIHEEPKEVVQSGAWARRADVYIYDYDHNQLLRAVVALNTGAVEQLEASQYVQLPLTEKETAQALHIALTDGQAGAAISRQYEALTSDPLQGAEQLRLMAYPFRPEWAVGAPTATAVCGLHRCAQLVLTAVANGITLNLLPVVDLSTGRALAVMNARGG